MTALQVKCEACCARPGSPCVDSSHRPVAPHAARLKRARRRKRKAPRGEQRGALGASQPALGLHPCRALPSDCCTDGNAEPGASKSDKIPGSGAEPRRSNHCEPHCQPHSSTIAAQRGGSTQRSASDAPGRRRAGPILDTGATTDSADPGELARFHARQGAIERTQRRYGAAWAFLAESQARHARRIGVEPERVQKALGSAKGPEPGAIGEAEEELRAARLVLDGIDPGLPRPVGPSIDDARARVSRAARELAKLRAWRRVAILAGRAARLPECGRGLAAVEPTTGQLVLSDKHGVPIVRTTRCGCRHGCYRCSRRDAKKRSRLLGRALRRGYEGLTTTPLLAVLTFRPPDPELGVTLAVMLDALMAALRRWQRSKAVVQAFAGGSIDLEATRSTPETRQERAREYEAKARELRDGVRFRRRGELTVAQYEEQAARLHASLWRGEWWHPHANLLLVPSSWRDRSRIDPAELAAVREAWRASLRREWVARGWDSDAGGMVRLEQPRRGLDGAAREVAKYAVKSTDLDSLDDGDLREALLALDGRRLSSSFGVVKGWRREVRECDEAGEPAYAGDGEDALGHDDEEGERIEDEAGRTGKDWIGRTARGTLVARSQAQWVDISRVAWQVHCAHAAARDAWLARVRSPS